jgi:serine/threonine-protein kinase
MLGQTIAHYHIIEKLGEGGMGVVYKARDLHLDRFTALKVLPPEKVADPERKRRFVQEAKAASALNHPNIITIYDISSDQGVDFIAMEHVAGKSLDQLIRHRALRLEEALKCAVQIADALAAAHAAGIIHRDLKPANIMVTVDGRVKVLDFGLAKLAEREIGELDATATLGTPTEEGAILGTVAYMSPEQAQGKKVDARSDIFSFGAVFYEMLTGRQAFQGESAASVLAAILRDHPAPASQIVEGLPREADSLLSRCLSKEPGERFQHTTDLKLALEELGRASPGSGPRSIAVLPFANLSADKDNEYFSDGLAEEIINALTKLPGLRVTARTSAFAFRGKDVDVREIGARLNVGIILEGSVRKAGNRIRVTAQLVNVAGGYHLWSERYDREMTDVFAIQDEISQVIVDKLRVQLVPGRPLVKRYTGNLEAYNLYLKGRYHRDKETREGLAKSKEFFEQAIAQDPNYAPAYSGIAELFWLAAYRGVLPPKQVLSQAKSLALKALELDDTLAEAHAILGMLRVVPDFDWKEAEREFKRALELDPASPIARDRYAFFFLRPMRRLEEATAEVERALELDPLSPLCNYHLGYMYHLRRQYDRAVEQFRTTIELAPNYYVAYWILGLTYGVQEKFDDSMVALDKAVELSGGNPLPLAAKGVGYGLTGRTSEAKKVLAEMLEAARVGYVPAKCIAWIYMGLGEADTALEWLDKSIEERDPMSAHLNTEPYYDSLRSRPGYQALLRKMNLEN